METINEKIINKAWDIYCLKAGMGSGAVDYWHQLTKETQEFYINEVYKLKTSKEWLNIAQSKIHLKIDVNHNKCGWNLNEFDYSFHNKLITLDEFKRRIKNSIVECNILELNKWLNESNS